MSNAVIERIFLLIPFLEILFNLLLYADFLDAGLTGLTHLDLYGAQITDTGTNYLKCTCVLLSHFWWSSFSS